MNRILIVGGAGFIGSHIVDAALNAGHSVAVIDDLSNGRKENLKEHITNFDTFHFKKISIIDDVIFMDFVHFWKPEVICHQAAQSSLRRSIDDPVHDALVNIIGTLNVIQAARAIGARLVFASTSAVYDSTGLTPFLEGDPIYPNLPYGIAKAAAEMYIQHSGLSYAVLRYGNVYGPRQVPVGENQLVPHCLNHILNGNPFVIHGDGLQTRDFVCVKDIARANLLAMRSDVCGIFNCGTGEFVSVNEVCRQIAELALGGSHIYIHGPAKAGEMRQSALDSRRAANQLGWKATTPLNVGLQKTIDWYKGQ